jgi:K+-sensing histidine kinase KdpD
MTTTLDRAPHDPSPRELELLLDLSRLLGAGESIDSVLEAVADNFGALLPFDRIEYSVIQGDQMVVSWVHAGEGPVALEPGTVCAHPPLGNGGDYKPFLIEDLAVYAKTKPKDHAVHRLAAAGYMASISCPLVVDGVLHGVIFFNTTHANVWNNRHRTLVELIAGHLSMAAGRTRLTEELRGSNEELRQAQAARTEFVAAVSHEIRTPLTAIVGLARAMTDDLEHLTREEIQEFARLIAGQASEVSELVDDLLVATTAEAGAVRVGSEEVDVSEVIASTIETIDLGVTPVVSGYSHLARADGLRLRQVLRNLLSNAARHGGPSIQVSHRREGDHVFIEVSDDGAGIPADRVEKMFDAFALTDHGHGESVGLGLSVSRTLAEAMGGSLTYERRDGRTVMIVRLLAV